MMRELIKAIEEDRLMDFISSNGYKFEKEELVSIINELYYAIYDNLNEREHHNIMMDTVKAIKELE